MSTPLTASSHEHHIVPTRTYLATLIALIVLMAITVYAGVNNVPDMLGISGTILTQVLALAIAGTKATLVILIFMGVKYATPLTKLWALLGFIWLPLIFLILGDYCTRQYEPVPGWTPTLESGLPRAIHGGGPEPMDNPNAANLHPRE